MKNILLILAFLIFTIQNTAQIANGSVAPNFTVVDINGNSHTLSNYLNNGKTVILEFSSVMCGADWKYDQTEAMQDFYNAFGPPGSNEIIVLYINDSNWNTIQQLNGISNPPTFGNWITGKPFPMILDSTIFNQYSINYTPNIYKICPNGIITSMGQPTASSCYSQIYYGCGAINGVSNYVKLIDTKNGFCNLNGSFKTKIKNYGSNPVNSVSLKLKENGVVISTKIFTVNIPQFSETSLEFDPINVNPSSTYTTELQYVNGVTNFSNSFSSANLPFSIANSNSPLNLHVKVYTYSCPNNMSWKITNSSETIVANGGPYGNPGSSCNGPMNTIVEDDIVLPSGGCFNLSLMDYNGFGWKNYSGNAPVPTNAGIEFYSNGTLIYSKMQVENFGSLLEFKNFINTNSLSEIEDDNNKISIFPNPSNGIFYINSSSIVSIKVIDLIGQVVYNSKATDDNSTIDLSKMGKGIYIAEIINENNELTTQKLILN